MNHVPVLLQEVIFYLDVKPGKRFIDATVGMAGHAKEILEKGGMVLGIDRDPQSAVIVRENVVAPFMGPKPDKSGNYKALGARNDRLRIVVGNFKDIKKIAEENGFTDVDGILFDLGMGSHQLDDASRGFSFQKEGPLDMRYDPSSPHPLLPGRRRRKGEEAITAADIVNRYPEKDLIRIFKEYGEERRFGKKIARAIVENRKIKPFETTTELFNLIKHGKPINGHATRQTRTGSAPIYRPGDTARRIFQALRIEVNQELENLKQALPQAVELLNSPLKPINGHATERGQGSVPIHRLGSEGSGGRLVVISFHSLEDRIVKQFFKDQARDCVCPPQFPVCRCEARAKLRILTKKPVTASETEIKQNPRSKSAKLRAAMKL